VTNLSAQTKEGRHELAVKNNSRREFSLSIQVKDQDLIFDMEEG